MRQYSLTVTVLYFTYCQPVMPHRHLLILYCLHVGHKTQHPPVLSLRPDQQPVFAQFHTQIYVMFCHYVNGKNAAPLLCNNLLLWLIDSELTEFM